MEEKFYTKITESKTNCLSCGECIDLIHPQCIPHTGNCKNCANFIVYTQQNIISQAIKEKKYNFLPHFNLNIALRSQSKAIADMGYNVITGKYNAEAKYLRYRKQTVKQLFQVAQRFGFKDGTVHLSVAIYDHFLQVDSMVDRLRTTYQSCKGVVSEQICTFVASVSLFIAAKYSEIKYPVVEDVC